jgi:ubiquinone biosynthesis protein Coq4
MKLVINRTSQAFDYYIDVIAAFALANALAKGTLLDKKKFKQEAQRIELSIVNYFEIKTALVFFDNKSTLEFVVNTCNRDIRIIQAKEQEA